MAETTHLALLSPDNVLRLISRNGSGIEEKAAVALSPEITHDVSQVMGVIDTLLELTAQPEPKAKPKERKKSGTKPKGNRRANHKWLSSAWLIKFVDQHSGLSASDIAKLACVELGRDYGSANDKDGGVVTSRVANLAAQGKLSRDANGNYFSSEYGMEWAIGADPAPPAVADEPNPVPVSGVMPPPAE